LQPENIVVKQVAKPPFFSWWEYENKPLEIQKKINLTLAKLQRNVLEGYAPSKMIPSKVNLSSDNKSIEMIMEKDH
jgi:hypothetical protein